MSERRDYLPVCNDQGVPLPDFQATFCVRCVQPECSRSRAGGLFETRVSTWKERLFENPPIMPKEDPLFSSLAAKRFIEIDMGRVAEIHGPSEWVDPRKLEESASPASKPRAAPPPKVPIEGLPLEPGASPSQRSAPRVLLNTDFKQGSVLRDEAVAPVEAKPVDRWSAPPAPRVEALDTGIPVVKTGAKFTFK